MNIFLKKMENIENFNTFREKVFLILKDSEQESNFSGLVNSSMQKYSKWLGILYLLYSSVDIAIHNVYLDTLKYEAAQSYLITLYISYALFAVFLINTILLFTWKNKIVHRIVNWLNFLLLGYPLYQLRKNLFMMNLIETNIFSTIKVIEFCNRILLVYLLLLTAPESYFMILILIVCKIFYISYLFDVFPASYVVSCFLLAFISYFYTWQVKTNFSIISHLNHKNMWYRNFLEHFNSGFISIKNGKINYINSAGLDLICRIKEISSIFGDKRGTSKKKKGEDSNLKEGNEEVLNVNMDHMNMLTKEEKIQMIKNNSMQILNCLLYDLLLKNIESLSSYNQFTTHSELNENLFDLMKSLNRDAGLKNLKEKFTFLGYKDILVRNVDMEGKYMGMNNGCGEENTLEAKNTLEVFYRYNRSANVNEIEIILNDVTKVRNCEKENTEIKYKTQILSKISHEFKNPIICISELTDQLKDIQLLLTNENPYNISDNNNSSSSINRNELEYEKENEELEENRKVLKDNKSDSIIVFKNPPAKRCENDKKIIEQIKSFSNYLLILIKNIQYFSESQMGSLPLLQIFQCDLLEVLNFTEQIGNILMVKYNKTTVKFKIIHNLKSENFIINTDQMKLKQVLVNMISNAIKFIISGQVELSVNYDEEAKILNFRVSDTGPGMSQEMIRELYLNRPFDRDLAIDSHLGAGLGLNIVLDILKQFNSKLVIESEEGKGSTFAFALDLAPVVSGNRSLKKSNLKEESLGSVNIASHVLSNNYSNNESKKTLKVENLVLTKPTIKSLFCTEDDNVNSSGYSEKHSGYNKGINYYIVIDDEKLVRHSNIRILKQAAAKTHKKIEVIEGSDGIECIYLVYKYLTWGYKIEAIVSDEMMTYMNGSKSADILKSLTALTCDKIPFISVTAFSQVNNPNVDYFFSKPLDLKEAEEILKI